jgi:hypothetical protein
MSYYQSEVGSPQSSEESEVGLIGPFLPLVLFTPFEIGLTNDDNKMPKKKRSKHMKESKHKKEEKKRVQRMDWMC